MVEAGLRGHLLDLALHSPDLVADRQSGGRPSGGRRSDGPQLAGLVATRLGELVLMSPTSVQEGKHVTKRVVQQHSSFGHKFAFLPQDER